MALPKPKDLASKERKIQQFSKGLNEDGSPKRKFDDNRAKELFRTSVRKRWMSCNTKLQFLEKTKQPDMRPNTRTIWVWECSKCKELFKKTDINVDHIKGEVEFTQWDQAHDYASSILDVSHADLQILCIPCHNTKSRAEALGIDWTTDDGWALTLIEQEITKINDLKATPQKQWLVDRGVVPASNLEKRKVQIREVLMNGSSS